MEDGASTRVEALQTEGGENGRLVGENGSLVFSIMLNVEENLEKNWNYLPS